MQSDGPALSKDERIAANRAAIFTALRDDGVLRAVASYTGSGDSGRPEGVRFEMPDGTPASQWMNGAWQRAVSQDDRDLDDAISDLAMELVERHFGGGKDGDGASGEVVLRDGWQGGPSSRNMDPDSTRAPPSRLLRP